MLYHHNDHDIIIYNLEKKNGIEIQFQILLFALYK